jgi:hypothetical protein
VTTTEFLTSQANRENVMSHSTKTFLPTRDHHAHLVPLVPTEPPARLTLKRSLARSFGMVVREPLREETAAWRALDDAIDMTLGRIFIDARTRLLVMRSSAKTAR